MFFKKYKPIACEMDVKASLCGHILGSFLFDGWLNITWSLFLWLGCGSKTLVAHGLAPICVRLELNSCT